MSEFQPAIVAFVCNWCSYAAADKAGGQKLQYPPDVKLIRVMCSGRVDPQFILDAFRKGADGVMMLGCPPGDCHYRSGNLITMKRMKLLKNTMTQFGINPERLKFDWVAAGESEKFQRVSNEMTNIIHGLGPLKLRGFVETGVLA